MNEQDYILASYLITTEQNPELMARDIAFEQTVEMPAEMISSPFLLREIVGHIMEIEPQDGHHYRVKIAYSPDLVGSSLNQLLNLIYGNISLKPGIRLIDLVLPASFLEKVTGPRLGLAGVRKRLSVFHRPLAGVVQKPVGLGSLELASMCFEIALAGIDIIKEDHSIADQPFSRYQERIRLCCEAILKAEEKTGKKPLYLVSLNGEWRAFTSQIDYALSCGVDGFILQPAILGLEFLRYIAEYGDPPFFIMAHPSFSGSLFGNPYEGIAPELFLGLLYRLAGADAVIFPNFSGRFSFQQLTCERISHHLQMQLGSILPSWPSPAGGVSLENLPHIMKIYPGDTIYLIGSDCYQSPQHLRERVGYFMEILEG